MQKIEIKNLSKRFGRKLLFRGVNAVFTTGVQGISGPNGSGKSTFLKCMIGLERPTTGEVTIIINNKVLTQSEKLLCTAFTAPYISLYPELTVMENLHFINRLQNKPASEPEKFMDKLGILDLKSQNFGSLSSGQQQRVRLASAMIKQSCILFLDEPGTNLDAEGTHLVESLISEYRSAGKIVLLASNQSKELDLCDRTIFIDDFKKPVTLNKVD
jgi:ABC-type multidrug transport system ATPase subunit